MFTRDVLETFETEGWKVTFPNEANVVYYARPTHPEERIEVNWQDQRPKHDVLSVRPSLLKDDAILQSLRLAEKIRTYVTDHSPRRLLYVTGEKKLVFKGVSNRDSVPDAFQRVCSDGYLEEIEEEVKTFLDYLDAHLYESQQQRFIDDHPDAVTILEDVFSARFILVGEKPKSLAEWLETNGYADILPATKKGETLLHLTIANGDQVIRNYLMYFEVVRFFREKGYIIHNGQEVITSLRRLHTRRSR